METAHIYVYGVIDYWQDTSASDWGYVNLKDIKNQYESQKEAKDITVHIHSEGGVVTEGFAIHDYLRSLGKPVKTLIEGTCASIATVIALAGDTRVMTSNANFFIHNPWGYVGGEKEQIQKYADELDKLEGQIADFYAAKTKITKDEALEFMKVETTFTAEQALEKGFITEIATVMRAVAMFNPNKNKKMSKKQMTKDEAESALDKALNKIKNIFGGHKPENKIVQDANGDDIDFPDLEEDDVPEVGDTATVDGSPAQGEYLMPSGETYVFEDGALTEIKPKEEESTDDSEEMAALQEEVQNLKKDLKKERESVKNLRTDNKKLKDQSSTLKKVVEEIQEEILNVKKSIGSGFKHEEGTRNEKTEGGQSRKVWKDK